jgi:hypothetical protein
MTDKPKPPAGYEFKWMPPGEALDIERAFDRLQEDYYRSVLTEYVLRFGRLPPGNGEKE